MASSVAFPGLVILGTLVGLGPPAVLVSGPSDFPASDDLVVVSSCRSGLCHGQFKRVHAGEDSRPDLEVIAAAGVVDVLELLRKLAPISLSHQLPVHNAGAGLDHLMLHVPEDLVPFLAQPAEAVPHIYFCLLVAAHLVRASLDQVMELCRRQVGDGLAAGLTELLEMHGLRLDADAGALTWEREDWYVCYVHIPYTFDG